MLKKLVSTVITVGLLVCLIATNPGKDDFAKFIENHAATEKSSDGVLNKLGDLIVKKSAEADSKRNVERTNYIVCSVFVYKSLLTGLKEMKFLGIAGHFIELK